jgi:hypothetical protein
MNNIKRGILNKTVFVRNLLKRLALNLKIACEEKVTKSPILIAIFT